MVINNAMIIMISVSWKPPVMVIIMFYHDQKLWWWSLSMLQLNGFLLADLHSSDASLPCFNCWSVFGPHALSELIVSSHWSFFQRSLNCASLQVNETPWLSEHVRCRCTLITPSRNQPTKWINTLHYTTLAIWSELFLHHPLNPKLASTSSMP